MAAGIEVTPPPTRNAITAPPKQSSIRPRRPSENKHSCCSPTRNGVQGNVVSPGVNEFVIPNYKQTWAAIRKIADAPEAVRNVTFKLEEYATA